MYGSSKFKCQLSINWHLNLIEVCATESWSLSLVKAVGCGIMMSYFPNYNDIGTLLDQHLCSE